MKLEKVALNLLLLSDKNPRLEPSLGEIAAIASMVKDQREKLLVLATDIVEHGLNPLEVIAVYPSEAYKGYFDVGEGNRRVCALKLLKNPALIKTVNPSLYLKFLSLSQLYSVPPYIEVGIFENEDLLQHWMEVRHMGEQGGKGLSKWNSIQKARFGRLRSGTDALLDFWDWLTNNGILTSEQIYSVTKTNWHRVLREKYYPFLKIQFDGHYFVLPDDLETFTERIRAVQHKLERQTVAIVYDQEKIESFFNSVSKDLYGVPYQEIIDQETSGKEILSDAPEYSVLTLLDEQKDSVQSQDTATNNTETHLNSIGGRDVFSGCKTIIPHNYPIRSANMRVNKIINELKRLDADEFPNACGTLLRALFELSAKAYLEHQDGEDYSEAKFEQAIKNAANKLRERGCIKNSQHSAICAEVDNLRKIFNGYMHETDGYPSSEALKNFFKSHRVFLEECQK